MSEHCVAVTRQRSLGDIQILMSFKLQLQDDLAGHTDRGLCMAAKFFLMVAIFLLAFCLALEGLC